MWSNSSQLLGVSVLISCGFTFTGVAPAQEPAPSRVEQFRSQYKMVRLGQDSSGLAVTMPGTVLVLQKSGVLGVTPTSLAICPSRYQDGELHPPGGFCSGMVKQNSRFFQQGEKVYPLRIAINGKKEQISFQVIACDSCNGVNPPTFYKAEILYQFPMGYLETATVAQVQDVIHQVLAVDNSAAQEADQGQKPPPNVDPPPPPKVDEPLPPIAPPPPPSDQPPPTINVGQTIDQVVAALGQPVRIANIGTKQIYIYKDLKVTFTAGKVSDVQ